MQKASFINHKVTPEGVYIRGLTSPGFTPDIEILVPRDDAEEFGWIDPVDEEPTPAEEPNAEAIRLHNALCYAIEDLEMCVSAHDQDMTPRTLTEVQGVIAMLKKAIATKDSDEKPVKTIPIVYTEDEEPDDIAEREKMLKKLAEWNAMSQRG